LSKPQALKPTDEVTRQLPVESHMSSSLKIVFHGDNAANFRTGLEDLLHHRHQIVSVSQGIDQAGEKEHFETADVVVGVALNTDMPTPHNMRLLQAPAAGTDGIQRNCLPSKAQLANCFGHENAIAEYVMAALLARHVPLLEADRALRQGEWHYFAGRPGALRTELGAQTLGLLGFGHIAKTLAHRAKAFGMRVVVANRSAVNSPDVDQSFSLSQLSDFMAACDAAVITLPLTDNTRSLVNAEAIDCMRPNALLVNVGRGAVIDESALHEALLKQRIGGAIIDTWYQYPNTDKAVCAPSQFDFASLANVLMTPHMSGWTEGTVQRRRQTIADNINRLSEGQPLLNLIS
jgi:phosphoglycerate dehydrogenase-like enzyme